MSETEFENETTAAVEAPPEEKAEKPAKKARKPKGEKPAAEEERAAGGAPGAEEAEAAEAKPNGNGEEAAAAVVEAPVEAPRPQRREGQQTQAAETVDIR